MTKKITDLEGRLEAAFERAGKNTKNRAAHTPGPWHVAGYGVLGPKAILSDSLCTTMNNRGTEERLANAHLIAASPDLLSAMEELLRDINTMRHRGEVDSRPFEGESAGYRAILKAKVK